MTEKISFFFEGQLAAQNRMDFYEASRFQYAAARLLVKLANFRENGQFPSKISYKNSPPIEILPYRPGSFGLDIIAPALAILGPIFLEVPLSTLFSYVVDRVFKPADDEAILSSLEGQRELVETFRQNIEGRDEVQQRTLDLLAERIERGDELTDQLIAIQNRIIADQQRKIELSEYRGQLRRIDEESEADLLTMSAPLLKEMNVPLRRSARKVDVISTKGDERRRILSADKAMADAVDLAIVDKFITTLDINVVQFNKHSGWGKFENVEWEGLAPFSVPGDILDDMKQTVVIAMNRNLVEVDCFIVRSVSGIPQRIIITDVRDIDE